MFKIALVGDSTSVLGFRALGVETYALDDPAGVIELWPTLMERAYALIFLTEPVYEVATELVRSIDGQMTPAVSVIPPTSGSTGVGRRRLTSLVEKAVGSAVYVKKEASGD